MLTKQVSTGNLLMVANYPSDTSYAWWLMEHFWATLAKEFETYGKKTFLAYPKITLLSETIQIPAIEPVELTLPWKSIAQAWCAIKFLRKNNIKSIYFTDQRYFNFKYFLMRLCGVKHIIVHDHTPGDRPAVRGLKGTIKSLINALPWFTADKILCVSKYMQARNISNTKMPAHKCVVVQNGIEPINCESQNKITLRKELKVPDNCIIVTTTGRANPYKRFDFIIATAKELKMKSPETNAIFLLLGDGPALTDLQRQVHDDKLDDTVFLLGFRADVRDILCASDIAFHAALGEGFSLSIIEYMSAGLPVLVPNIPSVSQPITHTKSGLIYKHDDPQEAAACIAQLVNDQSQRLAIGATAKAEADKKYSLERCTDTLVATLKQSILSES